MSIGHYGVHSCDTNLEGGTTSGGTVMGNSVKIPGCERPPLPNGMVWQGARGGGGGGLAWRVRRGVGAIGAAAGGAARGHREGQDRTQALRKPKTL